MTPRFSYVPLTPTAPRTPPNAAVLCLGNFDGVHLGHRALMKEAIALRDEQFPYAACGVFCFSEYSSDLLRDTPLSHLCTKEQRLSLFREAGMEFAILADFSSIRELSPEDFLSLVLIGECRCVGAVCGFNYKFGKCAAGNTALLKTVLGDRVRVLPPVTVDGEPVSSTRIRELLSKGDPETAARLLSRPYSISSPVLHGKALGRTVGIPTINQAFPEGMLIPHSGVYATACTVDGQTYPGVTNVGVRPTVDNDGHVNAETYLIDFSGDLYGKLVTTEFLCTLRPEKKFESLEQLSLQIQSDVREVRRRFPNVGK